MPGGPQDQTGGLQRSGELSIVSILYLPPVIFLVIGTARQGAATVIISLPPHLPTRRQQIHTKKYGFYSLMLPPSAGRFLCHWPSSFLPLGQQGLLPLLLTEKNIDTITMGHTHMENYTIILQ